MRDVVGKGEQVSPGPWPVMMWLSSIQWHEPETCRDHRVSLLRVVELHDLVGNIDTFIDEDHAASHRGVENQFDALAPRDLLDQGVDLERKLAQVFLTLLAGFPFQFLMLLLDGEAPLLQFGLQMVTAGWWK